MSTTSINSDNYAERQLIVVMPDDFVDSIRKFEEEIIEENKETSLKEAAILAMKLAIKTNIFTMAIDAYKALEKLKQNGFNATYIKKSESSGLTFPLGILAMVFYMLRIQQMTMSIMQWHHFTEWLLSTNFQKLLIF